MCIAVVKIWKVKSNLKQVVDYAEDKEKTDLFPHPKIIRKAKKQKKVVKVNPQKER